MATVFDAATYILSKQDLNAGDTISNLKLQKLVYYAQGFALAILDAPLFSEPIQAWDHGPVVEALYRHYKQYEAGAILPPPPDQVESAKNHFTPEQLEVLDEVCEVYGQYSAWKLRNFTHEEPPWIETYRKNKQNGEISLHEMKFFFKTLLVEEDDAHV